MEIERLEEKGGSDHFPILGSVNFGLDVKLRKIYFRTKIVRNPTNDDILSLLSDGLWPLSEPNEYIKGRMKKRLILHLKLYFNQTGISKLVKE
jgi:hypothetical protein